VSEQPFRVEIDKLRADTRARAHDLIQGAVPSVAPAVANAIFKATGVRLRALPFQRELLVNA